MDLYSSLDKIKGVGEKTYQKFKDEIVLSKDINDSKKITGINKLTYVDNHGRLCCTETLDSAIQLVKYNENKIKV